MYLKSLKIKNFRKFGDENNFIEFVDSKDGMQKDTINIATATTLIVGKNNSGKTTITKALSKLTGRNSFDANDFNFSYLNKILEEYVADKFENFPTLEFAMIIGIDDSYNNHDLITNVIPFMNVGDVNSNEFKVKMTCEPVETAEFVDKVKKVLEIYPDHYVRFQKYLKLLNETDKKIVYYKANGEVVDNRFKLSDLINIKIIAANKVINDSSLSSIFNKIVQYKYKTENMDDINNKIDFINKEMTSRVSSSHSEYINGALHAIENKEKLKIRLSSDLNFDILMKQIIRYQYEEQGLYIPEGQFGLGYSNLMSVIGEIIDYIEQYPNEEFHSKLNLICIEEPEAFMHPQMQELFIKNINEAVMYLLDGSSKKINSQLIVTTHSSHILNSKIQTSNSFNNINYITIIDNFSNVVNLHDKNIISEDYFPNKDDRVDQLKFIKKHIKKRISELFFSDAVIFVEGVTEETVLSYYIDKIDELNKYYISIFNINGAHGLVYHSLINLLKIPTLIITDLDIQRNESEKNSFTQVESLKNRVTTNKTIKKYNKGDELSSISNYFNTDNLYLTFQSEKVSGFFATSFEEAFILSNYNNKMLNKVLSVVIPKIYKDIVGEKLDVSNLISYSYKLQEKLSSSKSDFANELLYQLSIKDNTEEPPSLPKYMQDALDWLRRELSFKELNQEVEI